jgi:hypothetical protein
LVEQLILDSGKHFPKEVRMRFIKTLMFAGSLAALCACSSVQKIGTDHVGEEKILARIDGLSSRPDWVKESEPFTIENGKVTSIGMTTIPAENRVEAGYRISTNNGKAAIAGAIEQRLDFIFQQGDEGTAMDATQARYIGAEASKLTASSIRMGKHYWEKVSVIQSNGLPSVVYRIYSSVTMPEVDFKAAIVDAIRRGQGKGGLSADFAKKVDQHWDQFANAPAQTTKVSQGE